MFEYLSMKNDVMNYIYNHVKTPLAIMAVPILAFIATLMIFPFMVLLSRIFDVSEILSFTLIPASLVLPVLVTTIIADQYDFDRIKKSFNFRNVSFLYALYLGTVFVIALVAHVILLPSSILVNLSEMLIIATNIPARMSLLFTGFIVLLTICGLSVLVYLGYRVLNDFKDKIAKQIDHLLAIRLFGQSCLKG